MSTQEVDLEDGWAALKILISKLIDRVEGGLKPYSGDEIIDAHRIIYKLCNQKLPHDNDEFLYNRYKTFLSDYFNETVLPSLKDKRNECLLKELTERWPKYLSMVECISCLFDYLDELITVTRSLPSLKIVGVTCFFSLVYTEIHATVKDAVLALIENDSHVLVANSALLKNCIDFFAKMKSVDTDRSYSWDLETALFSKRAEYHQKIASTYISTIEFPEYILMVLNECLDYDDDTLSFTSVNRQPQVSDPTAASVSKPKGTDWIYLKLVYTSEAYVQLCLTEFQVYEEIDATVRDAVLALADKYLNEEDDWTSSHLEESTHLALMKMSIELIDQTIAFADTVHIN
ncbi:hypothetical protein J5N97_015231 [Dioscorea zingiberensis]|uniref:Cullin N-terminal domain-containing protein n=1 Tax=Dioscorea zingiberensis TaxID=325984 RepID=A0A9D5HKZ2_9LILI|nr:hypothetical protein J5N97_015231 [Dioscorea zingiberensis]